MIELAYLLQAVAVMLVAVAVYMLSKNMRGCDMAALVLGIVACLCSLSGMVVLELEEEVQEAVQKENRNG